MTDVTSLICSFVPDSVKQIPFDFVKRQFIYFFRHESRVNDLKEQIGRLKDAKGRVETGVEAATRNGEEVHKDVSEWLGRAREVSRDEKAEELERAGERARARCFLGLCPNLWSRRQLCKKAIAEAVDVAVLLKEYIDAQMFEGRVAYRPALTEVALDEDVENFESRANTFEGIMKALKDPSVSRVGVYGMGGVGKTTLVKQIQRKAREESTFDEIAFATVTSEQNTERIQGEIADSLGLKFVAETVAGRATELSHRLNNGQRILIVLDDIWKELSLPDIGISFKDCQVVDGNKMPMEGKCKILMTSRNEEVLQVMKSTSASNFEVALLPFPEAESLFTKIVDVPRGDNYKSIATEVIEKCAGSPIAIAAVAKALLRTASMAVWEDVRNKLNSSMANRSMEGAQQHVYATLKLSYEMLKNKEAQHLFLLLGMFDQGDSIGADVLLRYGVGLDLFDGVFTYHEARTRVNALLHMLRASSLLLKGDDNDTVKLHDLVRDVAANIANSDPYNMFRIEGKSDFKRLSKNGKLSHATGLFILPGSELPEALECPKLQFLHIRDKKESFIYDRLFEQTKELKVLDLTNMKELKSLPASLLSLTSLQSLCVDRCSGIRNISNIGRLQHLLVLSIRGSDIEELPEDLNQLTELQLLDLSHCSKLKVIPENLFSSLTSLEELYMGDSFNRWGVEGNASVSELLNLSSLTVLHIHIPQAEMIPEGMPFEKLRAYNIAIGNAGRNWLYFEWEPKTARKLIIFNLGESIHLIPNAKKLLASTEELRLGRLKGVRNVLYELDSHGFLHLKNLCVESSTLRYLVDFEGNRFSNAKAFPDLESLRIMDSNDLEMVCHGQPKAEALMGLRSIDIWRCGVLKSLFPLSMAKYLLQLEEIEVSDCKNLITIFDMGMVDSNEASETTGGIELSKLRSLTLKELPKFVGFCTQDQQMQPLFNERILLPHTLDTMPPRMSHGLVNLTSLTIKKCEHLKYLFSFSVVRTLKQLQRLEVSDCKSMQMIVLGEDTNPGSKFGAELSFPQLKFLKLECMENLIGFCAKNYDVDFPSLESLDVSGCYLLEAFFSMKDTNLQPCFSDKILVPHMPDTIFSGMSRGLTSLTTLEITGSCWSYLLSFSVARTLEQLQEFYVSWCQSMEVIVLGEETNPSNERSVRLSFPRLNKLTLSHMESLRRFCSKSYNVDFPSLKWLEARKCDQLEALFFTDNVDLRPHSNDKAYFTQILNRNLEDVTNFKCLKHLDFTSCDDLNYLFNHSVAFNLVLLEVLHVNNCKMMKETIIEEITAPNQNETIIFPHLKELSMLDCPNLINCCAGKQALKFPSLEQLTISRCPNLLSFYSTFTEGVGGPSNCTSPSFFSDKVAFPSLSKLAMADCDKVVTIFSTNIVHRFLGIQKIQIINCAALEMVYDMQGLSAKEHSADEVAQLEDLIIIDLAKLRCIWSEDPQGVAFQNLSEVLAWKCENLRYLFPPSVAQGLSQLKKLSICHCEVEEVVAVDKDEQEVMRFVFPQLKMFVLLALPKLKFFYVRQHTIEWPMLEFAESDNIEGLSKVLPDTPMQLIEGDIGFVDLMLM